MICNNCQSENLIKANYCKNCGQAFTQEEKDAAYKASLAGKLEKAGKAKDEIEKISDFISLKFITDNIFVRLALIVIPFVLGFIIGGSNGANTIKIRDSSQYDVYYNTTTEEYFVDVEYNDVDLMLYVPKGTQQINVYFTCGDGHREEMYSYSVDQRITVSAREDGYYTVEAVGETDTQSLTMYTVYGG